MIDGVCGGVAEYFNIDATIVRLVWIALVCLKGAGVLFYIIACIVMPYSDETSSVDDDYVDNLKSANVDEEHKHENNHNEKKESAPHSDAEFDDFFKKKK